MKVAARALVLCCFSALVHAALAAPAAPAIGTRGATGLATASTDTNVDIDADTDTLPPFPPAQPSAKNPALAAAGAGMLVASVLLGWMRLRRRRVPAVVAGSAHAPERAGTARAGQGFTLEAFPDLPTTQQAAPVRWPLADTSATPVRADPGAPRKRNKRRPANPLRPTPAGRDTPGAPVPG